MPEEKIREEEKTLSTEEMLKKSLQWSQIIYEQNRKIKSRLTMMVVGSYLRLLLILVPLILALIYLPPLFKQVWQQYNQLLGTVGNIAGPNNKEMNQIFSQISGQQIQEILKLLRGR